MIINDEDHELHRSYTPAVLEVTTEAKKDFRNPKFRSLAEVYRESLSALAQDNLRLREELGLDMETPLDWDSESSEEEVAGSLPGPQNASFLRSTSVPNLGSKVSLDAELRKSTSYVSRRHVLPMYLHSPLDKATSSQFQATLVQDLRRFSEFHEMGDLQSDEGAMSCYDMIVNLLVQFRLPLSPNSEIPLVWDMMGLCFIAYDVFAIPLQVFPLEEEDVPFLLTMGWITLCFWTCDIVMSNLVGYFNGPELVMQQFRITKRYLKTWFLLDAIVVIPDWFTRLAQDGGSEQLANVGRIIRSARAVRVIRLLRLLKLQKMLNKIYDFIDSEYLFIVMDILRLLLFIIVLNHVIACLWYLVGYIGYDEGQLNWLQHTGYRTNDSVDGYEQVIKGEVPWQYLTALHWSLTQFTPAGMDVFARNVGERIMSVIVLGFAVIIFSSVLASVSASMTALRNLQGDTKKQFWLLRRYLRKKKVTVPSRVRIIKFLEHVTMLQAKTVKIGDVKLLKRLSKPLAELLSYEIHKETVMTYPFLRYVGGVLQSVLVKLCSTAVKQVQLALQDCIFRAGDLGEYMHFVCSGQVRYAWPGSQTPEVDNNQLEVLGPLGFLPSLERLQAKHNRLRALAHPIAASPLLKTLELAFNNLDATDIPKAVSPLQRLTRLQLNDNVNELMEQYRPWILRLSPQVEELDNETVSEVDRRAALPPAMSMVGMVGMGRAVARSFRVSEVSPPGAHQGLLGLVAPKRDATAARPNEVEWEGIDGTPSEAKEALLERWKAAWSGPGPSPSADESGCQMCALACWCEALNAARSVPLVAHIREERRSATLLSNATARRHDEAVFALRRRHDFWTAFLQLCGAQYESLVPWPKSKGVSPLVSRNSAFELPIPGAERSRQELLSKVQSRWRGLLARRRAKRLRLERLCQGLSQRQRRRFIKVQAVWRGQRSRQVLRSKGYVLPGDRRLAEYGRAATQLQAALRGSRLRQKLRWAKEVSKMTSDDMEDCPEVDLEELLNDARRVAEADPFGYLSLPQGALPPKLTPTVAVAPMAAWGTPPSTGERRDREAVGTPETPKSQPDPGGLAGPRRSRSLSSTAESATIEAEGHGVHRGTRVEQAKEEWGFKDASTARNYLKAQKRRQAKQERPPTLPSTSSRSNLTQKSSSSRVRPGEGSCQSAQQAIEEYRRQQEAEDAQSSSGFSEFRSGSPNRKLMRSSKSLS